MKPIPTPEQLREMYLADKSTFSQMKFAHDTILTALGYERCGDGWGITVAEKPKQPEPWGEGHRLLVPGEDTWQEGDEFWSEGLRKWERASHFSFVAKTDAIGRRPLRNPWRKIADAPPEHIGARVLVGAVDEIGPGVLGKQSAKFTHYLLDGDLPPVPQEPEPRDLEREKFEFTFPNMPKELTPSEMYRNEKMQAMWEAWQAARKEKP